MRAASPVYEAERRKVTAISDFPTDGVPISVGEQQRHEDTETARVG